ncbi:hypothetical protein CROQUDRAFT_97339 [Cronartium quercuum f. sp. fusiforme G11]|uniref:Uncharacterized protein n=1 Tax=Cronartium quercuum f. sp. fusiforme G11 TaxID=708437 RepID=A0A9P6N9T9_9BASI|nr:hypothetical protein CROQUDRAFT_97339 [Cronartium quercuum f. sp. fusiforme G11]
MYLRWAAQAIPVEFRPTWNVNPLHVSITSGVMNLHIRWFRRGESRWPDRADISLTLTSGPPKSLPGCRHILYLTLGAGAGWGSPTEILIA